MISSFTNDSIPCILFKTGIEDIKPCPGIIESLKILKKTIKIRNYSTCTEAHDRISVIKALNSIIKNTKKTSSYSLVNSELSLFLLSLFHNNLTSNTTTEIIKILTASITKRLTSL